MNIIRREIRAYTKSLIIKCASVFAIILMMMSEFSAYYNNPSMAEIMDSMPQELLKAFSISGANLTTVSGFVSLASIYFFVLLGIFAVLIGSSIISKEERDKTAEFFLALPVTRNKVIFSKLIAAIINSLILLFATFLAIYISTAKYNPDAAFFKFLGLLLIAIFIIQMIFMSIGMLMASILKRYKKSGSISIFILLATYILSIFIGLTKNFDFLKYLTPFKYFEANTILLTSKLELVYILISIGIVVTCITGTFIFYNKRDLHL